MALGSGVGRNSGKLAALSGGEWVLEGCLAWGAQFERQGRRKPTRGGWPRRHAVGGGGWGVLMAIGRRGSGGRQWKGQRGCWVLRGPRGFGWWTGGGSEVAW
jgi:hypothetical protein